MRTPAPRFTHLLRHPSATPRIPPVRAHRAYCPTVHSPRLAPGTYRRRMPPGVLSAQTYVPTIGPVTWVAAESLADTGTVLATRLVLAHGPSGMELTAAEQELLRIFEPRLPGGRKFIWPTVRFA